MGLGLLQTIGLAEARFHAAEARRLPTHSRAAAIARQLKVKGCILSDRRIRQIIRANFPSRGQKNGNDRD
jgi:hypothetical protein